MKTIWLLAMGTFSEAIRRRTLLVFLGVAAVVLAGGLPAALRPEQDALVIKTLGLGVIGLVGVFISVILGINLIPQEIERRTIYSLLAKPVQRYQFVCGKYLGGLLTVLTSIAFLAGMFLLLMLIKEHGFNAEVGKAAKGVLLLVFQIVLVNSVAVFFSVFLSPFVNFYLTFALYLLGSTTLLESLADPTSDPAHPKSPILLGIFQALKTIVPNFANYNEQNPILNPRLRITNEGVFIGSNILYAVAYSLLLLTIASLAFSRKEI